MKRKAYSSAAALLLLHVKAHSLPTPELEFRFHPSRRWRFDFAFPEQGVAIELDGGQWVGGRHNRPTGYAKDAEKLNAAAELGWFCFHYTPAMVESGEAIRQIAKVLTEVP